jgi:hypothetical protein
MEEAKAALDWFTDRYGPSSKLGRGMFDPHQVRMGAETDWDGFWDDFFGTVEKAVFGKRRGVKREKSHLFVAPAVEPSTYSEHVASLMSADPSVRAENISRIEARPFEYVLKVWRTGNWREVRDGLQDLGVRWLRYLIDTDPLLDEGAREEYVASPVSYYNDNFGGVRRTGVGRTEAGFWRKPGHKELWLISVALAIPTYLSEQSDAFETASFLNVTVVDPKRLEELAGEW